MNSKSKVKHRMGQPEKNNTNSIVILVSITVIVIGLFGIILLLKGNKSSDTAEQQKSEVNLNNVSVVDGKQIIEIFAKGGYSPNKTVAKANIPTVIKFKTNGSFDCSIAVRIPSLKLGQNLPGTGETDIDIGSQPVGKLSGNCSMGMYFFEIDFQA